MAPQQPQENSVQALACLAVPDSGYEPDAELEGVRQLMAEHPYLKWFEADDVADVLYGYRYRGDVATFLRWGWQELNERAYAPQDHDSGYEGYLAGDDDYDFGLEKDWDMDFGFGEIETDREIVGLHNHSGWVTEDFIIHMTDVELDAWLKNELEEVR